MIGVNAEKQTMIGRQSETGAKVRRTPITTDLQYPSKIHIHEQHPPTQECIKLALTTTTPIADKKLISEHSEIPSIKPKYGKSVQRENFPFNITTVLNVV
uniref:Uncharacterized protein n=1 Tax=Romanomermis culicivorax TaxID=13658 RepID=A0A915J282_ROMCU